MNNLQRVFMINFKLLRLSTAMLSDVVDGPSPERKNPNLSRKKRRKCRLKRATKTKRKLSTRNWIGMRPSCVKYPLECVKSFWPKSPSSAKEDDTQRNVWSILGVRRELHRRVGNPNTGLLGLLVISALENSHLYRRFETRANRHITEISFWQSLENSFSPKWKKN